ncbi:hypothetical protein CYMTET_56270 [Cymbomonas tetramitiformis]|uniref:Uncharacterized protein n=1 Tax=Cymbomonas tetramitiformis TaxID=36881 RepID=A0AAE0BCI5_9CHLO|nr:hypothetical protein CYMTET_56270 [Cymbomonas tetramitiformis]
MDPPDVPYVTPGEGVLMQALEHRNSLLRRAYVVISNLKIEAKDVGESELLKASSPSSVAGIQTELGNVLGQGADARTRLVSASEELYIGYSSRTSPVRRSWESFDGNLKSQGQGETYVIQTPASFMGDSEEHQRLESLEWMRSPRNQGGGDGATDLSEEDIGRLLRSRDERDARPVMQSEVVLKEAEVVYATARAHAEGNRAEREAHVAVDMLHEAAESGRAAHRWASVADIANAVLSNALQGAQGVLPVDDLGSTSSSCRSPAPLPGQAAYSAARASIQQAEAQFEQLKAAGQLHGAVEASNEARHWKQKAEESAQELQRLKDATAIQQGIMEREGQRGLMHEALAHDAARNEAEAIFASTRALMAQEEAAIIHEGSNLGGAEALAATASQWYQQALHSAAKVEAFKTLQSSERTASSRVPPMLELADGGAGTSPGPQGPALTFEAEADTVAHVQRIEEAQCAVADVRQCEAAVARAQVQEAEAEAEAKLLRGGGKLREAAAAAMMGKQWKIRAADASEALQKAQSVAGAACAAALAVASEDTPTSEALAQALLAEGEAERLRASGKASDAMAAVAVAQRWWKKASEVAGGAEVAMDGSGASVLQLERMALLDPQYWAQLAKEAELQAVEAEAEAARLEKAGDMQGAVGAARLGKRWRRQCTEAEQQHDNNRGGRAEESVTFVSCEGVLSQDWWDMEAETEHAEQQARETEERASALERQGSVAEAAGMRMLGSAWQVKAEQTREAARRAKEAVQSAGQFEVLQLEETQRAKEEVRRREAALEDAQMQEAEAEAEAERLRRAGKLQEAASMRLMAKHWKDKLTEAAQALERAKTFVSAADAALVTADESNSASCDVGVERVQLFEEACRAKEDVRQCEAEHERATAQHSEAAKEEERRRRAGKLQEAAAAGMMAKHWKERLYEASEALQKAQSVAGAACAAALAVASEDTPTSEALAQALLAEGEAERLRASGKASDAMAAVAVAQRWWKKASESGVGQGQGSIRDRGWVAGATAGEEAELQAVEAEAEAARLEKAGDMQGAVGAARLGKRWRRQCTEAVAQEEASSRNGDGDISAGAEEALLLGAYEGVLSQDWKEMEAEIEHAEQQARETEERASVMELQGSVAEAAGMRMLGSAWRVKAEQTREAARRAKEAVQSAGQFEVLQLEETQRAKEEVRRREAAQAQAQAQEAEAEAEAERLRRAGKLQEAAAAGMMAKHWKSKAAQAVEGLHQAQRVQRVEVAQRAKGEVRRQEALAVQAQVQEAEAEVEAERLRRAGKLQEAAAAGMMAKHWKSKSLEASEALQKAQSVAGAACVAALAVASEDTPTSEALAQALLAEGEAERLRASGKASDAMAAVAVAQRWWKKASEWASVLQLERMAARPAVLGAAGEGGRAAAVEAEAEAARLRRRRHAGAVGASSVWRRQCTEAVAQEEASSRNGDGDISAGAEEALLLGANEGVLSQDWKEMEAEIEHAEQQARETEERASALERQGSVAEAAGMRMLGSAWRVKAEQTREAARRAKEAVQSEAQHMMEEVQRREAVQAQVQAQTQAAEAEAERLRRAGKPQEAAAAGMMAKHWKSKAAQAAEGLHQAQRVQRVEVAQRAKGEVRRQEALAVQAQVQEAEAEVEAERLRRAGKLQEAAAAGMMAKHWKSKSLEASEALQKAQSVAGAACAAALAVASEDTPTSEALAQALLAEGEAERLRASGKASDAMAAVAVAQRWWKKASEVAGGAEVTMDGSGASVLQLERMALLDPQCWAQLAREAELQAVEAEAEAARLEKAGDMQGAVGAARLGKRWRRQCTEAVAQEEASSRNGDGDISAGAEEALLLGANEGVLSQDWKEMEAEIEHAEQQARETEERASALERQGSVAEAAGMRMLGSAWRVKAEQTREAARRAKEAVQSEAQHMMEEVQRREAVQAQVQAQTQAAEAEAERLRRAGKPQEAAAAGMMAKHWKSKAAQAAEGLHQAQRVQRVEVAQRAKGEVRRQEALAVQAQVQEAEAEVEAERLRRAGKLQEAAAAGMMAKHWKSKSLEASEALQKAQSVAGAACAAALAVASEDTPTSEALAQALLAEGEAERLRASGKASDAMAAVAVAQRWWKKASEVAGGAEVTMDGSGASVLQLERMALLDPQCWAQLAREAELQAVEAEAEAARLEKAGDMQGAVGAARLGKRWRRQCTEAVAQEEASSRNGDGDISAGAEEALLLGAYEGVLSQDWKEMEAEIEHAEQQARETEERASVMELQGSVAEAAGMRMLGSAWRVKAEQTREAARRAKEAVQSAGQFEVLQLEETQRAKEEVRRREAAQAQAQAQEAEAEAEAERLRRAGKLQEAAAAGMMAKHWKSKAAQAAEGLHQAQRVQRVEVAQRAKGEVRRQEALAVQAQVQEAEAEVEAERLRRAGKLQEAAAAGMMAKHWKSKSLEASEALQKAQSEAGAACAAALAVASEDTPTSEALAQALLAEGEAERLRASGKASDAMAAVAVAQRWWKKASEVAGGAEVTMDGSGASVLQLERMALLDPQCWAQLAREAELQAVEAEAESARLEKAGDMQGAVGAARLGKRWRRQCTEAEQQHDNNRGGRAEESVTFVSCEGVLSQDWWDMEAETEHAEQQARETEERASALERQGSVAEAAGMRTLGSAWRVKAEQTREVARRAKEAVQSAGQSEVLRLEETQRAKEEVRRREAAQAQAQAQEAVAEAEAERLRRAGKLQEAAAAGMMAKHWKSKAAQAAQEVEAAEATARAAEAAMASAEHSAGINRDVAVDRLQMYEETQRAKEEAAQEVEAAEATARAAEEAMASAEHSAGVNRDVAVDRLQMYEETQRAKEEVRRREAAQAQAQAQEAEAEAEAERLRRAGKLQEAAAAGMMAKHWKSKAAQAAQEVEAAEATARAAEAAMASAEHSAGINRDVAVDRLQMYEETQRAKEEVRRREAAQAQAQAQEAEAEAEAEAERLRRAGKLQEAAAAGMMAKHWKSKAAQAAQEVEAAEATARAAEAAMASAEHSAGVNRDVVVDRLQMYEETQRAKEEVRRQEALALQAQVQEAEAEAEAERLRRAGKLQEEATQELEIFKAASHVREAVATAAEDSTGSSRELCIIEQPLSREETQPRRLHEELRLRQVDIAKARFHEGEAMAEADRLRTAGRLKEAAAVGMLARHWKQLAFELSHTVPSAEQPSHAVQLPAELERSLLAEDLLLRARLQNVDAHDRHLSASIVDLDARRGAEAPAALELDPAGIPTKIESENMVADSMGRIKEDSTASTVMEVQLEMLRVVTSAMACLLSQSESQQQTDVNTSQTSDCDQEMPRNLVTRGRRLLEGETGEMERDPPQEAGTGNLGKQTIQYRSRNVNRNTQPVIQHHSDSDVEAWVERVKQEALGRYYRSEETSSDLPSSSPSQHRFKQTDMDYALNDAHRNDMVASSERSHDLSDGSEMWGWNENVSAQRLGSLVGMNETYGDGLSQSKYPYPGGDYDVTELDCWNNEMIPSMVPNESPQVFSPQSVQMNDSAAEVETTSMPWKEFRTVYCLEKDFLETDVIVTPPKQRVDDVAVLLPLIFQS